MLLVPCIAHGNRLDLITCVPLMQPPPLRPRPSLRLPHLGKLQLSRLHTKAGISCHAAAAFAFHVLGTQAPPLA